MCSITIVIRRCFDNRSLHDNSKSQLIRTMYVTLQNHFWPILEVFDFAQISRLHMYKIWNYLHYVDISFKNLAESSICNCNFSSQHMLLLRNNIVKLVWLRCLFITVPHAYYIFCQITNIIISIAHRCTYAALT